MPKLRISRRLRYIAALVVALAGLAIVANTPVSNSRYSANSSADASFKAALGPATTGLLWWLDSGQPETLFQTSSCTTPVTTPTQPVKCWKDVRGTGHNQVVTTGTGPQLEGTNINGKPVLQFQTGEYLSGPNLFPTSTTSNMHWITVIRNNANANGSQFSLNGRTIATTTRFSLHAPYAGSAAYFDGGGCCSTNRATTGNGGIATGIPTLVNAYKTPTKNYLQINNGTIYQSAGSTAATITGGLVVGDVDGVVSYSIAELLVYDHALTTTELAQTRAYLQAQWGV